MYHLVSQSLRTAVTAGADEAISAGLVGDERGTLGCACAIVEVEGFGGGDAELDAIGKVLTSPGISTLATGFGGLPLAVEAESAGAPAGGVWAGALPNTKRKTAISPSAAINVRVAVGFRGDPGAGARAVSATPLGVGTRGAGSDGGGAGFAPAPSRTVSDSWAVSIVFSRFSEAAVAGSRT